LFFPCRRDGAAQPPAALEILDIAVKAILIDYGK
jgi:hypothetical protein